MNGPPPLRVEHVECRDCRRRVRLFVGDPLPRGWLAVPRETGDRAKAPRVRRRCDYVCAICADLARQRVAGLDVSVYNHVGKGGAP